MRIVCIGDTHELHRELVVPPGDLLVHAGDFTFHSKPPSIVSDFDAWLGSLSPAFGSGLPSQATAPCVRPRPRWVWHVADA